LFKKDKGGSVYREYASRSEEFDFRPEDESPPTSSHSKDSHALSGAAESLESLDLVPSSSPSDTFGTKESFIQKITRKGSSSKFNLSWKDRGGIFSKKYESSQGDADEEDEAQLGKSVESVISNTPSADKSSIRSSRGFFSRKSKKDKQLEASEKASETGDEEIVEE
jgi:hypothetical protein